MFIIRHYKIFLALSGAVVAVAVALLVVLGLQLGIDFTGGSILEVRFVPGETESLTRPEHAVVQTALDAEALGAYTLQPVGADGYLLRTRNLSQEEREAVLASFREMGAGEALEERFTSVGPAVGAELTRKALIAIGIVLTAIIIFITFAFRKVSEPVPSWLYGVVAIVTLMHDVLVPAGIFAILGAVAGVEIDALFVSALLAILGYSVNDTIVVFDRVRERLARNRTMGRRESFNESVGISLRDTYNRSLITAVTACIVLAVLFFFGPETTKYFALALLMGVIAGSYSSIFMASPLLIAVYEYRAKKEKQ